MTYRQHDSTKTRVTPVFDALIERDSTGRAWLPNLLSLPEPNDRNGELQVLSDITCAAWGTNERGLIPPLSLLLWLLQGAEPTSPKCWNCSEATNEKRKRLLEQREPNFMIEVSERLRTSGYVDKSWYCFEGKSSPDVYIETDEFVIVIEGKRTEHSTTTKTDWMPVRHQMIRHLDCAYEVKGSRELLGFFVVEGDDGSASVPQKWIELSNATLADDAVAESLPHRTSEQQREIMSSFLGITTWQAICEALDLPLNTLLDVAPS